MSEIKQKAQGINPYIEARDVTLLSKLANTNIYEALNIVGNRAKAIAVELKKELHSKLDEFASATDTLEEVHENKEQIEISKFYERLPNPSTIALHEFMEEKISFKSMDEA
jgi:DNA-directed RNA polymerase subunit K/omega